jgi:hypothetical protein
MAKKKLQELARISRVTAELVQTEIPQVAGPGHIIILSAVLAISRLGVKIQSGFSKILSNTRGNITRSNETACGLGDT